MIARGPDWSYQVATRRDWPSRGRVLWSRMTQEYPPVEVLPFSWSETTCLTDAVRVQPQSDGRAPSPRARFARGTSPTAIVAPEDGWHPCTQWRFLGPHETVCFSLENDVFTIEVVANRREVPVPAPLETLASASSGSAPAPVAPASAPRAKRPTLQQHQARVTVVDEATFRRMLDRFLKMYRPEQIVEAHFETKLLCAENNGGVICTINRSAGGELTLHFELSSSDADDRAEELLAFQAEVFAQFPYERCAVPRVPHG